MPSIDPLFTTFAELAGYITDANKRIYYVYMLSAVFLAVPVFYYQHKSFALGRFLAYLFNAKVWLAASARQDYALLVLNKFIRAFIYAPFILLMVPVALGFSDWLESVFGTMTFLAWSQTAIIISFTTLLFLFDDFSRFLLHWLLHKIPFLWQFHKVHHSAKVLTPFTVYRSHPLESYLYACRMGLTQGLAVGLAYYLFGPNLTMYDILGANAFVFAFNFMGANLRHSHVWLSWGDKFEGWLISPAQHQIHHSDNPEHFDANLGSALAIWDRMWGTLIKASSVGRIRFGLSRGNTEHQTLWAIYWQPFVDGIKCFRRRR